MKFIATTTTTPSDTGKAEGFSLVFKITGDKIEVVQKETQKPETQKGASETVTPGNS